MSSKKTATRVAQTERIKDKMKTLKGSKAGTSSRSAARKTVVRMGTSNLAREHSNSETDQRLSSSGRDSNHFDLSPGLM